MMIRNSQTSLVRRTSLDDRSPSPIYHRPLPPAARPVQKQNHLTNDEDVDFLAKNVYRHHHGLASRRVSPSQLIQISSNNNHSSSQIIPQQVNFYF